MDQWFFTGIGSRATPAYILPWMIEITHRLEAMGFTLRSGGAEGADTAFEQGIQDPSHMEIYLPWNGFNGRYSTRPGFLLPSDFENYPEATVLASKIHPAWSRVRRGGRAMHSRNVYQVLGQDLDSPSQFVLFWAPYVGKGQVKGGTNTAVQLAQIRGVPVINMFNAQSLEQVWNVVQRMVA